MDLFCPHCSKRVTVPDDKAGQVTSCPLCAKQFMAPSLAPPSAPAPKPPSPAIAPTVTLPTPPSPSEPAAPPPPPPPPLPPGEYTGSCTVALNGRWLAFVAPACLILIFVLTFLHWHLFVPNPDRPSQSLPALSLWGLIGEGQTHFLGYVILLLLCIPVSIAALLFELGLVPTTPQLAPILRFKNAILGLMIGLAFLFLVYDYVDGNLLQRTTNPIAVAEKIAFRLHFVALLASFAMFWLNWRTQKNLPLPKCEARW